MVEAELHCASAGSPEQMKVIGALKPVEVMTPTLVLPDPPGAETRTVAGPGNQGTIAKPGWTVNVRGVALLLALKL